MLPPYAPLHNTSAVSKPRGVDPQLKSKSQYILQEEATDETSSLRLVGMQYRYRMKQV